MMSEVTSDHAELYMVNAEDHSIDADVLFCKGSALKDWGCNAKNCSLLFVKVSISFLRFHSTAVGHKTIAMDDGDPFEGCWMSTAIAIQPRHVKLNLLRK